MPRLSIYVFNYSLECQNMSHISTYEAREDHGSAQFYVEARGNECASEIEQSPGELQIVPIRAKK